MSRNEEIARLYLQGRSTTELGRVFGITQGRVWQILKKIGVVMRTPLEGNKISSFTIQQISDKNDRAKRALLLYRSGALVRDISEKIGIRETTIYEYLHLLEYEPRKEREHTAHPIKKIWVTDSAEKFYILGYLFADGNVSQKGAVTAASFDSEYLCGVAEISDAKISRYREGCLATFGGKKLAKYLLEFGLTPRKSNTMLFPGNIPIDFLRDFIRGYFDGDGYAVSYKSQGKTKYSFGFASGSIAFLDAVQNVLSNIGINNGRKRHQVTEWGSVNQLQYGGANRARLMRDFIYYDSCLHLPRKFKKFPTGPLWVQNY